MSRIGRLPVRVPGGVSVDLAGGEIKIKGPKGQLARPMVDHVSLQVDGGVIHVSRDGDDKAARANHGLMRALVASMVHGVTTGFEKKLQIEGTGFRAEVKGRQLVLTLGYSHPIEYAIPTGIAISVDKNVTISVTGADKQQVGQVAAIIRGFREPDSYKGKGIKYADEVLRLKEGKSA